VEYCQSIAQSLVDMSLVDVDNELHYEIN
jgi:hypothetical protein